MWPRIRQVMVIVGATLIMFFVPAQLLTADVGECMWNVWEIDPISPDDPWHHGMAPPPTFHPDCEGVGSECEWSGSTDEGDYSDYHHDWVPGLLASARHFWVADCEL